MASPYLSIMGGAGQQIACDEFAAVENVGIHRFDLAVLLEISLAPGF
jgi:hypothetical protein